MIHYQDLELLALDLYFTELSIINSTCLRNP